MYKHLNIKGFEHFIVYNDGRVQNTKTVNFFMVNDCAKYNGVDRNTISAMLTGKRKNRLNVRYKTVV